MIFNTWTYAFFLLVAFCVYWLASRRARPYVLIGLGFYFYWYYYPPHALLIAGMTLLVLAISWLVRPSAGRQRRLWFVLGVGGSIGTLAYFKYQGFAYDSLTWLLVTAGVPAEFPRPEIRAPLAISFFTFEYVHYLIEVYRGTFAPAGLRDFGLFIMFFPTLICGPIKRFQRFQPQEYAQRALDPANVNAGLERIIVGLAKKTLVADTIAPYCLPVFAHPEAYTWAQLWLGVYGYALQIYFDFAGYSDIAIGSARLFGYSVPENFDYPYLQPNIAQFWRSWHMSLTSWITDYVYIPLGGSRRGEVRAYVNRLASMTLCGLWHGAALHFAVWGLYHGIALNVYRGYQDVRARVFGVRAGDPHWASQALAALMTFHVVCIGWVLFVCDLDKATVVIARLLWLRD